MITLGRWHHAVGNDAVCYMVNYLNASVCFDSKTYGPDPCNACDSCLCFFKCHELCVQIHSKQSQEQDNEFDCISGICRLDRILPEQYREQWHSMDAADEQKKALLKAKALKTKQKTKPPTRELHSVFMSEGNRRLVEDLIKDGGPNTAVADMTNESLDVAEAWDEVTSTSGVANEPDHPVEHVMGTFSSYQATHDSPPEERETRNQSVDERAAGGSWNNPSEPSADTLAIQLLNMGFGKNDVQVASTKCRDFSDALDWLVLNVPESELPATFAPDASKSSVQVLVREKQEMMQSSAAFEFSVRFLRQYGYAGDDCQRALANADGNEMLAWTHLFHLLVYNGSSPADKGAPLTDSDGLAEIRADERLALLSIFGEEGVQLSDSTWTFRLGGTSNLELEVLVSPFAVKIFG